MAKAPRSLTWLCLVACLATLSLAPSAQAQASEQKAPFDYVWGKAYYILPETTTDESGYFSLNEGPDGKMYVGTAAYGENAFLVEFDPETEEQRIVIDVHKLAGIDATGIEAQSKIHTRNFVSPSGKIYVGSKQGYAKEGENPYDYPAGYVVVYDPKTDEATNLGMVPFKSHGLIDVVADEERNILYLCTQDDQTRTSLWYLQNLNEDAEHEYYGLFSDLTFYSATLLDEQGHAHALSKGNQLVSYNPDTNELRIRQLTLDGEKFEATDRGVPTWIVMPDGRTAYLLYMSEPGLYRFDLMAEGNTVAVEHVGDLLETEGRTDSRSALHYGPDGRVYAVLSEPNATGFGSGRLHHLVRYDPESDQITDLGVLAVKNPDFFDFEGKESGGEKPPWSHGYHTLPDGTLTPLHNHMALIITKDGDAYVTIIYPYTLLRIEDVTKM